MFTALVGGSAGQLVMRLVMRRRPAAAAGPVARAGRTVLICLVIPPLLHDRDQQGLHDLAVDSIALRR